MGGEIFQIYVVQISVKCIYETKNWIIIFIHVPQAKLFSKFSSSIPMQKEITYFPEKVLFEKLSPLPQ